MSLRFHISPAYLIMLSPRICQRDFQSGAISCFDLLRAPFAQTTQHAIDARQAFV